MIVNRIFPRYSVNKLSPKVIWNDEECPEMTMIDVSLSGLQVKSPIEMEFKNLNKIKITLKQQNYTVNVKKVWDEKKEDGAYYYGLRIKFEEVGNYDQWLTFIKV